MKLPLHTGSHNGREQSTHHEGLPLEIDLDEPYDELWWVKKMMQREQVRDFFKS